MQATTASISGSNLLEIYMEAAQELDDVALSLQIFDSDVIGHASRIREEDVHFIYYTKAETALRILKSGELWMRSARVMNDFGEIEWGMQQLRKAFDSPAGKRFKEVLESVQPGLHRTATENFWGSAHVLIRGTYMTCLSEHKDSANKRGVLSMWRAYGVPNGVGLVFSRDKFLSRTVQAKVQVSPVRYWEPADFERHLDEVAKNLAAHSALLKKVSPGRLSAIVVQYFWSCCLYGKHPAFAEEKEWRAITVPGITNTGALQQDIETIAGVPQAVQKFSLVARPCDSSDDEMREILRAVIVGPCEFPDQTTFALGAQLVEMKSDPAKVKLINSRIPLRVSPHR